MNQVERFILALAYATAMAAAVGVASLALHLPHVWPGMVIAFIVAIVSATYLLRVRS